LRVHRDVVAVNEDLMAELGYAWDDIRNLPAGWEKGEAALGARLELSAILARDFAQAGLWGLKDPRLCRLLPLWSALFAQLKVKPSFILLLRHPRDVVASLAARDGLSAARAGLLWLRHVLEAEWETRGHPRTIVHYEDLVAGRGWRSVVSQISREIGVIWPAGGPSAERAIDAYLSSDLRHCRSSDHSPGAATTGTMQGWLEAIYSAASSAEEPRLRDICDAESCELDHAGELFLPIIGEVTPSPVVSSSERQHPQDREIAELTQRLNRAELESAELRALVSQKDGELKALKQADAAVAAGNSRLLPPHAVAEAFPRWRDRRCAQSRACLRARRAAGQDRTLPFHPAERQTRRFACSSQSPTVWRSSDRSVKATRASSLPAGSVQGNGSGRLLGIRYPDAKRAVARWRRRAGRARAVCTKSSRRTARSPPTLGRLRSRSKKAACGAS
jgi:hypothetical protein